MEYSQIPSLSMSGVIGDVSIRAKQGGQQIVANVFDDRLRALFVASPQLYGLAVNVAGLEMSDHRRDPACALLIKMANECLDLIQHNTPVQN